MEQATQVYLEYNVYIKALKTARNEKIKIAIKEQYVTLKGKVSRFTKTQIKKFKNSIKDLDQKAVSVYLAGQKKFLEVQTTIIKKTNRFKKNVVRKYKTTKAKINRFKKSQIKKFKKKVKTVTKFVKNTKIKIVKKTNRFKKNVVRKYKTTKTKINRFKKSQIKKFKKSIKDIDKSIQSQYHKVEEKFIAGQIKVIETANRFKKGVVRTFNTTKAKVGRFSKTQITKIKKTFVSSEKVRMQKQQEIDARRKKIEELKNYRNQLLFANTQSVSTGRSRGVFYIWMFALISLLSMGALIIFNIINK